MTRFSVCVTFSLRSTAIKTLMLFLTGDCSGLGRRGPPLCLCCRPSHGARGSPPIHSHRRSATVLYRNELCKNHSLDVSRHDYDASANGMEPCRRRGHGCPKRGLFFSFIIALNGAGKKHKAAFFVHRRHVGCSMCLAARAGRPSGGGSRAPPPTSTTTRRDPIHMMMTIALHASRRICIVADRDRSPPVRRKPPHHDHHHHHRRGPIIINQSCITHEHSATNPSRADEADERARPSAAAESSNHKGRQNLHTVRTYDITAPTVSQC